LFDVVWIGIAFLCGLLGKQIGLPPLAGYLLAGFVLHAVNVETGDTLEELSEFGITLLLFSIGLKLKLSGLLRPQVWAVAGVHMAMTTTFLLAFLWLLGTLGLGLLAQTDRLDLLLLAFGLSFSSTVFAVKVLEARGDMASNYGSTAIGILIIQDLAAVGFLVLSTGKVPSPWAVLLFVVLWPGRWLLWRLLDRTGHGELLILFGLAVAVGGAQLFDQFGVKGDLGALLLGVLLAQHPSASELSKSLLGFKDLFLVGFFLTVGLTGTPSLQAVVLAVLLVALLPLKSWLYFALLTRFRMRARTSALSALSLTNYSEFGLIVAAVAYDLGYLDPAWLGVLAVTLALSFVASSPVNINATAVYERYQQRLRRYQRDRLIPEERPIDPGSATALVIGMGRVGTGAFDHLVEENIGRVVGVESSQDRVSEHQQLGREVVFGSGTDPDVWARVAMGFDTLELVVLTMPKMQENEYAARELRRLGYRGRIASAVKFADHERVLAEAGVDFVSNFYTEAGAGLAEDASRHLTAPGELGSGSPAPS
jgi:predicted Kef-type K+ transport protein